MNDREREAVSLGMEALDQALIALGRLPVDRNPDFVLADSTVLDFPNVVLHKPGVAPLGFLFGPDLNVSVGPFSEVLLFGVLKEGKSRIVEYLEKVLRSTVGYREGKWFMALTLALPGAKPWLRMKVAGGKLSSDLEPSYDPYA